VHKRIISSVKGVELLVMLVSCIVFSVRYTDRHNGECISLLLFFLKVRFRPIVARQLTLASCI
jgi:hypothetical protein